MGNFADDTRIEGCDGHYCCSLSPDWEFMGPNGGYLATLALRAAGAESRFARPASFAAHYLGVATFDEPVQIEVEALRTAKAAESLRVSLVQKQRAIMEALVWTVDTVAGIEHFAATKPDVPTPDRVAAIDRPRHKFWNNFVERPANPMVPFPPPGPLPPVQHSWFQYRPAATFGDPFVDAARALVLLDTLPWLAATRCHVWQPKGFFAPTIDMAVTFHQAAPQAAWLLCSAEAHIAHAGLVAARGTVWTEAGLLLASSLGHMLCRPVPVGSRGAA